MNRAAMLEIVVTRLRKDRRLLLLACAAAAIVGFLQPHAIATGGDPFARDLLTRNVWIAGPIFFGTWLGVVVALAQRGTGRLREIELCEQAAPLYGRELARATALVPCIVVTLASLLYWFVQFVTGLAAPPAFFVLSLATVLASTLVALSATLRRGAARFLYVASAFGVATISYLLAVYGDTLGPHPPRNAGHYYDFVGVVSVLVFCTFIAFAALRQYGEALARYDPVPDA